MPAVVRDGVTGGTSIVSFNPDAVDASVGDTIALSGDAASGVDDLQTGDAVLYNKAASGDAIGGLSDGTLDRGHGDRSDQCRHG